MNAKKTAEVSASKSENPNLKLDKTNINFGYLICAFALLLMGVISIVAQNTDVPSIFNLDAFHHFGPSSLRKFMLLGLLPFIVSIIYFTGVVIIAIRGRALVHVAVSVLSFPYLVTTFSTLVMVGFIHTQAEIFDAMVRWSPMRSPNSFLVRNFFVLQVMFVLANVILLLIPVVKKGIIYKIILGVVLALNVMNLFTISGLNIYLLFIGMWNYIVFGANFFGINEMAIILPVCTGIALVCGSHIKPQNNEAPKKEPQQVDEHVGSEEETPLN